MEFSAYMVVYLITNLFTLAVVHRFVSAFFEERRTNLIVTCISYAFYFILISLAYLIWDIPVLTMTVNLIAVFAVVLNYKASLEKQIFVTVFFYIFMFATEVIVCAITGYFNFPIFDTGYYENITGIIIMRIIAYLEALIFYNIKSLRKNEKVTIPQWIVTLFIPLSTLFIKIFLLDSENSTQGQIVASTIIIFLINILTFYLYNSLAVSYAKETKAALVRKEKEMYYNQCLIMQETNANLQSFRHEVNNQFISMNELLRNGKYEELEKYLGRLTKELEISRLYSNTGNIVIDSIVNYKLNMVKVKSITTEIAVPSTMDMNINDLVIIIGNILDNATRAATENNPDGKIYFKLFYSKGRILIKETNNYVTPICYENGEIQSSKDDKENHGFGLKNIEEVVKRYDGYMDINHNGSIFSIDIILFVDF